MVCPFNKAIYLCLSLLSSIIPDYISPNKIFVQYTYHSNNISVELYNCVYVVFVELCLYLYFIVQDGFTILSAKPISKGAGLDPLRAQKMVPPEDKVLIKNNPQIVSVSAIVVYL